jgi:hypothetical protein
MAVKKTFDYLMIITIMTTMANFVTGCSDDNGAAAPSPPPDPGTVKVTVRSSADSSLVGNSNVVLYQAETNETVSRGFTDQNGTVSFAVDAGNYSLNISTQGFDPVPIENTTPIPFPVTWEQTVQQDIFLNVLENAGGTGYVMGFVDPAISNFLILAKSQTTQQKYYTASGPDGFFVLFNLPYDAYNMDALKSGFKMLSPVSATISSQADVDSVSIPVVVYQGSVLTGTVTFLASQNSTVDITLLDPETRAVIPGLTVMSDVTGLNYRIDGIPDGSYLAWASLQNDGYVIDPDWLFKNPGGLDIAFVTAETRDLDFSVTDVITVVSPTNPANATIPFVADSQIPVFKWMPYPSAKEYFIEVKDFGGSVLWGGINNDGTVNHGFIGAGADSVVYNFDGQPGVPVLQPGEVYQWRLWADKGAQQDSFVEQLISSSEDLRGVFQLPENPSP